MEVTTLPLLPTICTCQSITIICHSTETFPWQVINHTLRNTSVPYCAKFVQPAKGPLIQFETLDFQVIDSAHKLTDHMQQFHEGAFHEGTTKVRLCFDQRKTFSQTMTISCYQISQQLMLRLPRKKHKNLSIFDALDSPRFLSNFEFSPLTALHTPLGRSRWLCLFNFKFLKELHMLMERPSKDFKIFTSKLLISQTWVRAKRRKKQTD